MLPKCGVIIFSVLFFILYSEVDSGLTVIDVSKPKTTLDPDWWKTGVFYQIYPRSFKDSNADGIGDLNGITSKLDDLKESGITGVWLSPICKSGGVDQGYDISNFKEIDPEYGTMADFDKMVYEAHQRDLKVILDFVPNHSSNQHEWFEKSENRFDGYEDFYTWRDGKPGTPPNNWLSVFHDTAWKWSTKRNQYYLHQFAPEQPDLNYANPLVKLEMKDVLKFWLDMGIDGFRVDAVPFLFEDDQFRDEPASNDPNAKPNEHESLKHIYTMDQNKTFDLIYEFRDYINQYNKENPNVTPKILMSEAYTSIQNTMRYYGGNGKEGTHIPFNFLLIPHNKNSGAIKIVKSINEWLDNMPEGQTANWVVGNHDNHRVATRFGPELVDNINILIASLPGVMISFNGEEIGQENGEVPQDQCVDPRGCKASIEDYDKVSRDFERTPYQWDDTAYAGFSDPTAPSTWLPVSKKYNETNLKKQKGDPKSHFEIYKFILKLRKEDVFREGKAIVEALSNGVIKITRGSISDEYGNYVILINLGKNKEEVQVSNPDKQLYQVIQSTKGSLNKEEKIFTKLVTIAAYETIVLKVISRKESSDWWKHALIYQIYPRSFKDSDNDGNGDLIGILYKLPYLRELGVDAVWLSPIYKSPQVDQGYDISDFRDIDPIYGTMKEFDKVVLLAEILDLKIIMDFVPNHSSNEHEWFKKSENKEPGYEDYYVWKDGVAGGPPNNWLSIFKNSAWTKSAKRGQYYLHQFDYRQPDLNYRNPAVRQEMKDVLKFWLDKGVSGFRMDAVPYLVEDERFLDEPASNNPESKQNEWKSLKHVYTSDVQETLNVIYEWREFMDIYSAENGGVERIMMTEAYTDIFTTMYYYGSRDSIGAHFTFNFQLIEGVNGKSDAIDFSAMIKQWVDLIPQGHVSNWVLGNHDKHRLATRFGPENLDGFNMLGAILPGVMISYNGEEIGLENGEVSWEQGQDPNACNGPKEDFDNVSRDFERTPYHWDSSTNAGFNIGKEPWLPVSEKYIKTNLLSQINQTASHYELYRRLIQLRKLPAFVNGTFEIAPVTKYVLASLRKGAGPSDSYFHIFNLGRSEETFNLKTAYNDTTPFLEIIETNDQENLPAGSLLNVANMTLQAHQSVIAIPAKEVLIPTSSSAIVYALSKFVIVLCLLINAIDLN